jgi:hypothetical protein
MSIDYGLADVYLPRHEPERPSYEEVVLALDQVLRLFTQHGHPGIPATRTGWIDDRHIAAWRTTLRAAQEPFPNMPGPDLHTRTRGGR